MQNSTEKKQRGSASSMSILISLGIVLMMSIFSLLLPTPDQNQLTSVGEASVNGPILGAETTEEAPAETGYVVRVIDGDTILLESGARVRYIGINTPEDGAVVECFGSAATERNRALVENKTVQLVKDVSETDRYGRLLRYVYVDDVFVNQSLVLEGFAQTATYPPDVLHQNDFLAAEKIARDGAVGLWGEACPEASAIEANSSEPSVE